jgi:DNA-binding HxlR family transcriptional regulator
MLTLRNLERDGLLCRKVYATLPPGSKYTATGMARELHDSSWEEGIAEEGHRLFGLA